MLRRIREPFGKAGLIVAVVALVAALVGGAYAASGGLTGKQKKEVKKIAKQFAGENGAPGPAGSQGPKGDTGAAGTNGKDGAPGTNGKDGTNGNDGESVNIIPLAPKNGEGTGGGCKELGGAKFVNGTNEGYACNGEAGTSGSYPKTLPTGHSMEGLWEVQGEQAAHLLGSSIATISFPLPLETTPTNTFLIFVGGGNTEEEKTDCPGTPSAPEALPGFLCVYAQFEPAPLTFKGGSATTFGALMLFAEADTAVGSWAVTAP
jgi:hypothetical protein